MVRLKMLVTQDPLSSWSSGCNHIGASSNEQCDPARLTAGPLVVLKRYSNCLDTFRSS